MNSSQPIESFQTLTISENAQFFMQLVSKEKYLKLDKSLVIILKHFWLANAGKVNLDDWGLMMFTQSL